LSSKDLVSSSTPELGPDIAGRSAASAHARLHLMLIFGLTTYSWAHFVIVGYAAVAWKICESCTNFVVSKGASADGSTHLAYNSDGQSFYGYMTHLPAADHGANATREIWEFGTGRYMGSIPEASHTYNVIGNMNEHQVSIGETTFDGVESLAQQPGAVIDYYSLMWITLQRVRTAQEAIATMDALTKEHGYASTGESFTITDPNEAWIMDFIGKGRHEKGGVWVARRVPDGYVGAHANQARIRTFERDSNDTLYSADVVDFAKRVGLYPAEGSDEEFSFADAFDPITPVAALTCEARVWDLFRRVADDESFAETYLSYVLGKNLSNWMPLFVKSKRPVQLNDTMWLMRGHYEGSYFDSSQDLSAGPFRSPYYVRPSTFTVRGQQYMLNRDVGYIGTFFHFVAQARGSLPGPGCAGGVIWFGVDDASLSVRTPMYSCAQQAPETWGYGFADSGRYEQRAAFWAFNVVANFAYSRWNLVGKEVQQRVAAIEARLFSDVAASDREVAKRALAGEGTAALETHLSNFSVTTAEGLVDAWVAFFPELFVKYRDYLVASPAPPPSSPKDQPPPPECNAVGYDQRWYERIVEDTGDRYLVPKAVGVTVQRHADRKVALFERLTGKGAGAAGKEFYNVEYV